MKKNTDKNTKYAKIIGKHIRAILVSENKIAKTSKKFDFEVMKNSSSSAVCLHLIFENSKRYTFKLKYISKLIAKCELRVKDEDITVYDDHDYVEAYIMIRD